MIHANRLNHRRALSVSGRAVATTTARAGAVTGATALALALALTLPLAVTGAPIGFLSLLLAGGAFRLGLRRTAVTLAAATLASRASLRKRGSSGQYGGGDQCCDANGFHDVSVCCVGLETLPDGAFQKE